MSAVHHKIAEKLEPLGLAARPQSVGVPHGLFHAPTTVATRCARNGAPA